MSSTPAEPGRDRTGRDIGFGTFRRGLVDAGRLPPRKRAEPGSHVPKRHYSERLNVLWIMADQLRADVFGFAGHKLIKTPNLDRLAEQGAVFTQSFCNSPVCAPSRASMATGHYLFTHGVIQNSWGMRPAEVTFPTLLRQAGYRTASIGKTHCGRGDKQIWEYSAYLEDAFGATKPSQAPFDPSIIPGIKFIGDEVCDDSDHVLYGTYPGPAQTTKTYALTNATMKWLYWHDDPRPFFLRVSYDDPHPPVLPPPPYDRMYDPDEVPAEYLACMRESFAGKPATVREFAQFQSWDRISEADHRRHIAYYLGLVSHMDTQIGRLLDYLEELDYASNTLVLLNADHGHMLGEHGMTHKGIVCYEGVTHIPTVMKCPGRFRPGMRIDALVEGVDLMPTFLDMLNVPVPTGLHGHSWVPLLDGTATSVREEAFIQWEDYGYCIRGKCYKLTWFDSDQCGEMYDLETDPWEMHNLYSDAAYTSTRNDLLERLQVWRACYAQEQDHP